MLQFKTKCKRGTNICLWCVSVCAYLIVEDDHDKNAEQHWLHQEDDVVSTEREHVTKKKKSGWMSMKIKTEQAPVKLCKKLNSHDQMLAGRLLSFLLGLTFSLITYTPYPGRHHQHQGVQAGHACTRGQQMAFHSSSNSKNWWIEPFHA